MIKNPSVERLNEVLEYDPCTGIFIWKIARKHCTKGAVAGRLQKSGYIHIGIDGNKWAAHRIAWAMHYGEWAASILDHKNCDKTDNRIANIRLANKSQNAHNSGKWATNTSGLKCVFWNNQRKKWMSITTLNGKRNYLGLFNTKDEAHAAYAKFANDNIGEFARTA